MELICADAIEWLAARPHWTGRELVYCDPPYLMSARRSDRHRYACELAGEADHRRFLDVAARLPCMVMISGYASPLYAERLAGWRLVTFQAATRGRPAIEHLWCNFPAARALHDCRYLGTTFRERERIKRKAERWRARFAGLDPLERQAVLSVCLGAPIGGIAIPDEGIRRRPSPGLAMPAAIASPGEGARRRRASPGSAMPESPLAISDDGRSPLAIPDDGGHLVASPELARAADIAVSGDADGDIAGNGDAAGTRQAG